MKHLRMTVSMRTITILLFALVAAWSVSGQTPTGTVQGSIRDGSGAVVANASITLTRLDTNQTRSATSDKVGRYIIPFVQPATYTVTVKAAGFQPESQENILVEVAGTREVDFALHVGQVTEQIEVSATANNLDLDTSSLGQTVQSKLILDLPDNGRNVFDFASLVPGVNTTGGASTPHIGGSRNGNNEQQIDGMSNILPENNVGNNLSAYTPVLDSVQEVNVQTSVLAAEYGRFSGGTISLITKGGTNDLHGTFFEFLETSGLAALPFGSYAGATKPDAHQYQTGGTIGGPVIIPHLYHGRNKTFFFFDYEDSRQSQGTVQYYSVPLPEWLTGDFSGLNTTIYDPLTVANDGNGNYIRQPFPGNKIPADRMTTAASMVAQKILSYYPKPTNANLFNNFQQEGSVKNNYYHLDVRIDEDVTKKWHSFVRLGHNVNDHTPLNDYNNAASPGGYDGPSTGNAWSLSFDNTVTFSPTLLGEFRYGLSKQDYVRTSFSQGFDLTTLGFPEQMQQAASKNVVQFPNFNFSEGYSDLDAQGYVPELENPLAHDFNGSLIKILGGHSIKVGGEFRYLDLDFYQYAYPSGDFQVDNSWTQQNPQNTDGSGNPYASFLLGLGGGGRLSTEPKVNSSSEYLAIYAQDDWKVTPQLTLNLGVRWDVEIPRVEQNNQLSVWDPTAPSPLGAVPVPNGISCAACSNLLGSFTFVGHPGSKWGRRQGPTQWADFGPRAGAAWNPVSKLAIRAGLGMVYQPSAMQAAGTSGSPGIEGFRADTPFSPSFDNEQTAPIAYLDNPFPDGYVIPEGSDPACLSNPTCIAETRLGSGIYESYFGSYRTPYSIQWNTSLQYALPDKIKFEVGYLGNHGVFLIDGDPGTSLDQLPTSYLSQGYSLFNQVQNPFYGLINSIGSEISQPTIQASKLLLRYPQYPGGVYKFRKPGAMSIYHGVTIRADKDFSNGLAFTVSFTGGKVIDNSSSSVSYLGPASETYANQYNPRAERTLSAFDVSRQFVGSWVYELPVGRGKWLLPHTSRLANTAIGGWQVSGIYNYADGTPIVLGSVDNGTTSEVLNTQSQRPTWNGKDANLKHPTRSEWFDTSGFSVPAPFTIGNAPRTLPNVRNPSYIDLDFSLTKNTVLTDRYNLQFRFEMFNAPNHPLLGSPDTGVLDGTFGQIGGYSNNARQIQLGMKLKY